MKKEFRFPTILGLILLMVSIGVGVYFTGNTLTLSSKASADCSPQNLQITNLTHTGATVSFVTSVACQATLKINNQIIQDLKLQTANTPDLSVHLHYFDIKQLKEKTTYEFSIISGSNNYTNNSYVITTGSTSASSIPTSNLAWGKVYSADGKTPGNAIVYLNIPGAYPLSSIVTTNGNWSISLANTFNDSKNDWFTAPQVSVNEDIIVVSEDNLTTQVLNNTSRNNPVPDIIIGKNSLEPVSEIPNQTGRLDTQNSVQSQKNVDILNPKNGEMINAARPDFFGVAPQKATIIIELHSDLAITGQAISDTTGTWHWSPPENLTPGEHTITIKTQNSLTGLWETVTRTFTVLAADNITGPNFVASGSASTITPSSIPTITTIPTPTSTLVPTLVPTEIVTTIVPEPTTRVAYPSTTVKPPVTGETLPTVVIFTLACLFIYFSFKLLL